MNKIGYAFRQIDLGIKRMGLVLVKPVEYDLGTYTIKVRVPIIGYDGPKDESKGVTEMTEQEQVVQAIQNEIKTLPESDQAVVHALAIAFRSIVTGDTPHALLAFALVGAEITTASS